MTYAPAADRDRPEELTDPARRRWRRCGLVVPVAAVVTLVAGGCAAAPGPNTAPAAQHPQHPTAGPTTSTSSKPAPYRTVQQLAATVGCQATLAGKAADFRQASCMVDGDQIVFVDFDTTTGQRDWLDYAEMYGGVYLVGDRWALSGKSKEYMTTLQATLGGQIEER